MLYFKIYATLNWSFLVAFIYLQATSVNMYEHYAKQRPHATNHLERNNI